MSDFNEFCCHYCGNYYDYEDEFNHSKCKEYYEFILDSKIENMRERLIICLYIKKNYILSSSSPSCE